MHFTVQRETVCFMTAEFHNPTPESIVAVEDLFDKLEARAEKEGGRGWRERRQKQVMAAKTIHFYVQENAETRLKEFFETAHAEGRTDEDIDSDPELHELHECRVLDTQFSAYRSFYEDDDTGVYTYYGLELSSASAVEDPSDIPAGISDRIEAELDASRARHAIRLAHGEIEKGKEEFDDDIEFATTHVFEMKDQEESIKYTIKESYKGVDFAIPYSTYSPAEPSDRVDIIPSSISPNTPAQDDLSRLFNDIVDSQDLKDIHVDIPANLRVAQVLAILSLLEFGEAQTEEEQKVIEDLTQQ